MNACRFVIDEGSFDLTTLPPYAVGENLKHFTDLLGAIGSKGELTEVTRGPGAIECHAGLDVATVLVTRELVERDVGNRLLTLLSRCVAWDESPAVNVNPDVTVSGVQFESYGIARALAKVSQGIGLAVATMLHRGHRGLLRVSAAAASAQVSFVASMSDAPMFYRSLYDLEDVTEDGFFALSVKAFPFLDFANGLRFNKFDGAYRTLRSRTVQHLGALNDGFFEARTLAAGDAREMSVRLGVDVSLEGNTRSSERLMALRDVVHDGVTYRCEWHSKLEPHRNRIHFYPKDNETILIGLFVAHLET